MTCAAGLVKSLFIDFAQKIGYLPNTNVKYQNFTANTGVAHHSKKTFALVEADYPFNVVFERSEKSLDIKSIGHDNFDGDLTHNVSAHPAVDKKTGEFLTFGYHVDGSYLSYSVFNK